MEQALDLITINYTSNSEIRGLTVIVWYKRGVIMDKFLVSQNLERTGAGLVGIKWMVLKLITDRSILISHRLFELAHHFGIPTLSNFL